MKMLGVSPCWVMSSICRSPLLASASDSVTSQGGAAVGDALGQGAHDDPWTYSQPYPIS